MKKVRFESPIQVFSNQMDILECHSPRPFIDKQQLIHRSERSSGYPRLLTYNPDPVQRFENGNNSPYPVVNKTVIRESSDVRCLPSNDLDLSMLDSSCHEPRQPILHSKQSFPSHHTYSNSPPKLLTSVENLKPPNVVCNEIKNNDFFIKRDNLKELNYHNVYPLQDQLSKLSLNKENVTLAKQAEMVRLKLGNVLSNEDKKFSQAGPAIPDECQCHNCIRIIQNAPFTPSKVIDNYKSQVQTNSQVCNVNHCEYATQSHHISCQCKECIPVEPPPSLHNCQCRSHPETVDKRNWMVKKNGQSDGNEGLEIERQSNVKEKREPTVADLFKIIKLQNEQLQLLQEKVDKFISASNNKNITAPIQSCTTERVALDAVGGDQHKISIGVMTSFEMVTTSTVINKEIVTQTNESGHIQCNRSHISIKEVVSKSQQGNMNFLDGITPVAKASSALDESHCDTASAKITSDDQMTPNDKINDDKTLNELSLYNVQVDNAITPLISPEQSLYLDVRDYSESDPDSDDQSNVGWTYYNKVMTHVNGMLQDSDMPSSASAMYRNTRQQCVQMQIDRTNVSVTKRVKFGDDPLGLQQPHIYAASTDTSLKMNQLAAKYLKSATPSPYQVALPKPTVPIDMAFATRNYMERHQILQGGKSFPLQPAPGFEMPRFLDITALKQQPKYL